MFSIAGESWLRDKRPHWAAKTGVIEKTNFDHLKVAFSGKLLSDIQPEDVLNYWALREGKKAAAKTISLEVGTLRGILLHNNLDAQWAAIRKKVKLKKAKKVGRFLTLEEQTCLIAECRSSRSRSLHVVVTLALRTCMRYSEIRLLRWRQIDFGRRVITVGESKTDAGTGREIPMIACVHKILAFWAENFPQRKPNHYVFPFERYGSKGTEDHFGFAAAVVYDTDPTRPIGNWKEAWEAAKIRAGVSCRFHDLRHSGCTELLDAGAPINAVTEIMGWSASTAVRMIREVYGHAGPAGRRRTMQQLEDFLESRSAGAQKEAQPREAENASIQ